ncbi:hypothetical protein ES702_04953 [subsurface metagenome]
MKRLIVLIALMCFVSCDNLTGEKGDPGEQGDQGIPGIKGEQGITGQQGEPGEAYNITEFTGVLGSDDWNEEHGAWVLGFTSENSENFSVIVFIGIKNNWVTPDKWFYIMGDGDIHILIYPSSVYPVVEQGMNYKVQFLE